MLLITECFLCLYWGLSEPLFTERCHTSFICLFPYDVINNHSKWFYFFYLHDFFSFAYCLSRCNSWWSMLVTFLLSIQIKSDATSYSDVYLSHLYLGREELGSPTGKTSPYIFLPSTRISPITNLYFFFFFFKCVTGNQTKSFPLAHRSHVLCYLNVN